MRLRDRGADACGGLRAVALPRGADSGRVESVCLDRENGVHYYENLVVLHSATQPAVLLEAGVIVNRGEELALRDSATQRRIAAAVAEGVRRCLGVAPPRQCAGALTLPGRSGRIARLLRAPNTTFLEKQQGSKTTLAATLVVLALVVSRTRHGAATAAPKGDATRAQGR